MENKQLSTNLFKMVGKNKICVGLLCTFVHFSQKLTNSKGVTYIRDLNKSWKFSNVIQFFPSVKVQQRPFDSS